MVYSRNKEYNRYIRDLIVDGEWQFHTKGRGKHGYLEHIVTGRRCPVPFSPRGDSAGFENFKAMLRRASQTVQPGA